MRTYRAALALAALTLMGLGATTLIQGGWQAVAAALAMMGGVGSTVALAAIGAAGEQPRRDRPAWEG